MKPVSIGTPLSPHATRVVLLGAGELGKEVVIELQRFGVEVIACDRYADAPAMQVAHRSHVIDMLDRAALRRVIEAEKPHLIVPEIEAIATQELVNPQTLKTEVRFIQTGSDYHRLARFLETRTDKTVDWSPGRRVER